MGSPVSIVRCSSYNPEEVFAALHQSIDLIGGIGSFVKKGDRVLIKPNLLMGKAPEKAVTTHPSVIQGMIRLVKDAGGIPSLGDSPGIGSAAGAAAKAGIKAVAEAFGCPIVELNRSVLSPPNRETLFKGIELDQTALGADVLVNLPKWKTHSQMLMTLGVKNLFGCVPGPRKALWHLKAGENRKLFARMLFDVYQILKPSLTILDGIIGMEGNGPSSGRPVPLGLVLAGGDALSVDQTVCDLLKLPRRSLMTNRVAQEQGYGKGPIEVLGERIERISLPEFQLPNLYRMDWYLPAFLKKTVKHAVASRPVIEKDLCRKCHHCLEICPPKAIYPWGTDLAFDYGRCIRCFCCQEICPEGAISIKPGWASRFAGRR